MRQIKIEKKYTDSSIAQYANQLKGFNILTPQEEADIAARINIDPKAREKLINHNLRFVISVAKQYHGKNNSISLLDLIQEGNLGLIHAVDKYDPTTGFRFISYAVWWIRAYITKSIESYSKPVRINQTQLRLHQQYKKWERKFEQKEHRLPDIIEIRREFPKIDMDSFFTIVSMDVPEAHEGHSCEVKLADILTANDIRAY
jgi:RNA polymerase primary sigma factor